MIAQFEEQKPNVAEEWQEFLDITSPQSDDTQEYVEAHPESMHAPFCDITFNNTGVPADTVHACVRGNHDNNGRSGGGMQTVRSTTSVLHSGNKKRCADAPPDQR